MKKAFYCEKLEKTINFLPNEIKFCCSCAKSPSIAITDEKNINLKDIEQKRKEIIQKLADGIIPEECNGCNEYKEKPEETLVQKLTAFMKKPSIESIVVNHFKQCNSNCVYCTEKLIYENVTQKYEILPLIKQLYKENLINKKNLRVELQGGDISELKELDDLLKEFNKNGCQNFAISMNGIKYIQALENAKIDAKSYACISIDSGCQETYYEIKYTDGFNKVIENLKEYNEKTNMQLALKYVIVQGKNDSVEELQKFLDLVKELDFISFIILDIDFRDTFLFNRKKFIAPAHYHEMFKLAEDFCKINNIPMTVYDFTKAALENKEEV